MPSSTHLSSYELFPLTLQWMRSQKSAVLRSFSHRSSPTSLTLIPATQARPYFIHDKTEHQRKGQDSGKPPQLVRGYTQARAADFRSLLCPLPLPGLLVTRSFKEEELGGHHGSWARLVLCLEWTDHISR